MDTDLSLIKNIKTKADLFYFIYITPGTLKATALNITKQYPKFGIYNAKIYPELSNFYDIIDENKTYIINQPSDRFYCFANYFINLKLLILLIKLKIDIFHITNPFCLWNMALYFFRKKLFLTVHDPIPHSDQKAGIIFLYRKISFGLLKNFIIFNEKQRNIFIRKNKLESKNICVTRLGICTYLQHHNKNFNRLVNKEYILFFGRIVSYKGLEYLFPAMRQVHEEFPDMTLVVAGSGEYYFDISDYKSLGYIDIRNRYIPNSELANLIYNALFVICPYNDATQSGVVMSAFAFCKPVLATNVGGLSEYIEHEKSGMLIKPNSVESIVVAIFDLLKDRKKLQAMVEYIYNNYSIGKSSWDKITNDIVAFYNSCMNNI
jgi:glycosyltransferase involved in cell wall biosynthesis